MNHHNFFERPFQIIAVPPAVAHRENNFFLHLLAEVTEKQLLSTPASGRCRKKLFFLVPPPQAGIQRG
ncbi:MAG TPA: hypothetical protein VFB12_20425 [Ktedonobacteraceae bacterium]|nr:hypothetical protein [Ktedonobacteraceae bacterium]